MLVAHATTTDYPDRRLMILGLSAGNIRRLIAGEPIRMTRETHGDGIPADWVIDIVYGTTEQELLDLVAPAIGPNTEIRVEPRLGQPEKGT